MLLTEISALKMMNIAWRIVSHAESSDVLSRYFSFIIVAITKREKVNLALLKDDTCYTRNPRRLIMPSEGVARGRHNIASIAEATTR